MSLLRSLGPGLIRRAADALDSGTQPLAALLLLIRVHEIQRKSPRAAAAAAAEGEDGAAAGDEEWQHINLFRGDDAQRVMAAAVASLAGNHKGLCTEEGGEQEQKDKEKVVFSAASWACLRCVMLVAEAAGGAGGQHEQVSRELCRRLTAQVRLLLAEPAVKTGAPLGPSRSCVSTAAFAAAECAGASGTL